MMYNIVITGIQPWDIEIGSNCKNIAIELSKNHKVLYVNPPMDRITQLKQCLNNSKKTATDTSKSLIQINENLTVFNPSVIIESINALPFYRLFKYFNRINNKRLANEIKKAIDILKFNQFILFTDSDMFRSQFMKELLKPIIHIYYSRDNLLAVNYWKKYGRFTEPYIMRNADFVVTNSVYLATIAKKFNNNSYFIGQGCDLALFNPHLYSNNSKLLSEIPRPIIGYTGALNNLRLNPEALIYIAKVHKDWSIVLVGPEDEVFKKSSLHKYSNVYFLGNQVEQKLPAFINEFDVTINPQRYNEVTRGNYPRKIDEYLAMGKPVVAKQTEAMLMFKDYSYLVKDDNEWVEQINLALISNDEEKASKRRAFALEHSWENNVNKIIELITNHSKR